MNSRTGEVTWEMPTDLRLAAEQAAKMAKVLHEADVAMITAPMAASARVRGGGTTSPTTAPTTAGDFDARLLTVLRAAETREGAAGPTGGSKSEEYRRTLAKATQLVAVVASLDAQGEKVQRLSEQARTVMDKPEFRTGEAQPVMQAALGVIVDSHAQEYEAAQAKATAALRELHGVLLRAGSGAEWDGAKELGRALHALRTDTETASLKGPSVPQNLVLGSVREDGQIR